MSNVEKVIAFLPTELHKFRSIGAVAKAIGVSVTDARIALAEAGARPSKRNRQELWTLFPSRALRAENADVLDLFQGDLHKFRTIEAVAQSLGVDVPEARIALARVGARPSKRRSKELWTRVTE